MEDILYSTSEFRSKKLEGFLEKAVCSAGFMLVFANAYQLREKVLGRYI